MRPKLRLRLVVCWSVDGRYRLRFAPCHCGDKFLKHRDLEDGTGHDPVHPTCSGVYGTAVRRSLDNSISAREQYRRQIDPSAAAVVRFTVSSKIVGCSMGRSAEFAPFQYLVGEPCDISKDRRPARTVGEQCSRLGEQIGRHHGWQVQTPRKKHWPVVRLDTRFGG